MISHEEARQITQDLFVACNDKEREGKELLLNYIEQQSETVTANGIKQAKGYFRKKWQ